jgi:hypothetical protein
VPNGIEGEGPLLSSTQPSQPRGPLHPTWIADRPRIASLSNDSFPSHGRKPPSPAHWITGPRTKAPSPKSRVTPVSPLSGSRYPKRVPSSVAITSSLPATFSPSNVSSIRNAGQSTHSSMCERSPFLARVSTIPWITGGSVRKCAYAASRSAPVTASEGVANEAGEGVSVVPEGGALDDDVMPLGGARSAGHAVRATTTTNSEGNTRRTVIGRGYGKPETTYKAGGRGRPLR